MQDNKTNLMLRAATKYFARTLQRCVVVDRANSDLLRCLSKVLSLTKLDLRLSEVENEHLEIIINSFPSLESLTLRQALPLEEIDTPSEPAIKLTSPPPPATKTLRSLKLYSVDPLFVAQCIPHFSNLRKLDLFGLSQELDLLPLSSSLPHLKDMTLDQFTLKNLDSLKNLVHLSTLRFCECIMPNLSFLIEENSLPELTTLCVDVCEELSATSFASLPHAPNLQVLQLTYCENFNNECLQHLENMVHLQKLDLSCSNMFGDCRPLKTLMQNLFQLEELNLRACSIGNQGAIAGALYNTHSRLRVLNLSQCSLVDDDLNGIGALKNTLEALDLSYNKELTTEGLRRCKDLVKLKRLSLMYCHAINDLSPLTDCLNLEELKVTGYEGLTDELLKVFSEEPNSFPNLRVLDLSYCKNLTEKVVEHLAKNNHLVHRLKELSVARSPGVVMTAIPASSPSALNHICQLKGLRRLHGILYSKSDSKWHMQKQARLDRDKLTGELVQRLTNLEGVD